MLSGAMMAAPLQQLDKMAHLRFGREMAVLEPT